MNPKTIRTLLLAVVLSGQKRISFNYEPSLNKQEFKLEYEVITGCGYYYHSSIKEWKYWD